MRWRHISEEDVLACVNTPEFIEPGLAGKTVAWRKLGDEFLCVTYRNESDKVVIITAVIKRKSPRGLT